MPPARFISLPLLVFVLAGCADMFPPLLGAEAASIAVFGRSLGDIGVSAVTGRNCSLVRLDRGQSYCAPPEPAMRPAYCTRTLAQVDCWEAPPPGRNLVAQAPDPTPEQNRYRVARWPKALTAEP